MKQIIIEFENNIIIKLQSTDNKEDAYYNRFKMSLWTEKGLITSNMRLRDYKVEIIKLRNFFNSIELPKEEE
ncbi:hypothetical protein LCGC14_2325860 [marine sediment metagenome]|uniref:Uncharacterized protein n=1 Tax=marine sediment metagenome TaxID=412755 RepID=A0A0F9FBD8_9ZZZZ